MDWLLSFDALLLGIETLLTLKGVLMLLVGVGLGIAIGATPGMSPSMGVALLVPFTFGMEPAYAFILFVAAYQAANYGGSITAIAVNTPGTASAVVTAIDGYELTRNGVPGKALGAAVVSSAAGGLLGTIILIVCAVPIARFGLRFGPPEYFALAFLGLTTVVTLGGSSPLKSLVALSIGLLASTVGLDPFSGEPRYTFGEITLFDGFSFIPAMIGLFALAEILYQLESNTDQEQNTTSAFSNVLPSLSQIWGFRTTLARSSLIGTAIGVIPGAGATIASFISYGQAKRWSKAPEEFGKGSLEGIAASEGANSSSVGGALVPLLSLGIPGSATDAVLLGALTLHGLVAGPELFSKHPDVVYGIFVCLLLANVLILLFGLLGNRLWLSLINAPKSLLYTLITLMCILGSFTVSNNISDCWVCLSFGVLGWLLKRHGFQPAPVVLGLILGEMLEMNFRRSILMGDLQIFLGRPIALVLLAVALFSVLNTLVPKHQE